MRRYVVMLTLFALLTMSCVDLVGSGGVEKSGCMVFEYLETPDADVAKEVWNPKIGAWVDTMDAPVSSQLKFRVYVHNIGDYDLFDVVIVDTLPPFLTYVKNSSNPREPDVVENNTLVWEISSLYHCCGGEEFEVQYIVDVTGEGYDANDLTVTANSSGGSIVKTDFSMVHAYYDTTPPSVDIKKPVKALYVNDEKILPLFFTTVVVGKVTVEVETSDMGLGVEKVEFYVDDDLKENDTTVPYAFVWDEKTFGQHTIKVVSYDLAGNQASDSTVVWKIF